VARSQSEFRLARVCLIASSREPHRVKQGAADETATTKALALEACPTRSCLGASLGGREHGRRPGALEPVGSRERHRLRRVRSGRQSRQTPNNRLHAKTLSQRACGAGEAERRSSPHPIVQCKGRLARRQRPGVRTYHGDQPCLTGSVGWLADHRVKEDGRDGAPRFAKWTPNPFAASPRTGQNRPRTSWAVGR
jgi:hypothetical protein